MPPPAEVLAHYALGEEQDRLTSAHGLLELLRTQDILQRHLPPVPARILDVGGGPGVYAEWLAGLGYSVHLVDPVPLHVEQASRRPGVTASLGDARTLAAADSSYDVVLALGPLYHLPDRSQRLLAWREFGRVVVPGGLIVAAAISRYAAWNDVMRKDWLLREGFAAAVDASLRDGRHRNDDDRPELFTTAYFHRPEELATEPLAAGLEAASVLGVEVTGWLLGGLPTLLADPQRRSALLDWLRRTEAEPSLHGASSHLVALTRRSA
ncbi:MAG: class I SAM-dependent methyltransferase [Geodermatophilaceae bacterium]|nr:class I SAM-dependent methyltransferase [Geodermatophilaceae bacterium]MDQ3454566.1 class I SAM-dependent methyltransferase [Actinomycetota bacterium]